MTPVVLVADQLPIFAAGVRGLLVRDGPFEVLEAASLAEVLEVAERRPPEIAIVELDLPPVGAVPVVKHLVDTYGTRTVVWSLDPRRDAIVEALRAGAVGFLHKEISPAGLVRSMRGVASGEAPLPRALTAQMIEALRAKEDTERRRLLLECLSAREHEVLAAIADGRRNREIAVLLAISEFTVKRHVQNILRKLEVATRREAAALLARAAEQSA